MKNKIAVLLLLCSMPVFAQQSQYFKDSEMNGFPSLLKQLAPYEKVSSYFDYIKFDEQAYNSLFYQSYVTDNGNHAAYYRMDITMPKKLVIEPTSFPNYKLVLNPKLEKGYVSKQPLQVSVRETSVSAVFTTDFIGWFFPQNVLQTMEKQAAQAIVNTKSVEYYNDGALNKFHGILVKDITGFTMEPSFIPETGIELLDFKKSEIKFLAEEAYEFPFLVFENNELANYISNVKKFSKDANIQSPEKYKSSVLIKNVGAKITFKKTLNCELSEIYFFGNAIAGVIDFPLKRKNDLVDELNAVNTVANRSPLKLKPNGDFPTVNDHFGLTRFKIEQDSKSIKMYFLIIK